MSDTQASVGGKLLQTGKQVTSVGGKLTLQRVGRPYDETAEIEPPTYEPFASESPTAGADDAAPLGVPADALPTPPEPSLTENQRVTENSDNAPNLVPEATPAAAELAEQAGVDLQNVEGSGAGGKITKADVQDAAK